MSKLNDVKQTKKAKEEYQSPLIMMLQETRTKAELISALGLTDREIRALLQELALFYPVLSRSQKGFGYRLAKNINELNDEELAKELAIVEGCISEIESRKKALKKRERALIAWSMVAKRRIAGEQQC